MDPIINFDTENYLHKRFTTQIFNTSKTITHDLLLLIAVKNLTRKSCRPTHTFESGRVLYKF